MWIFYGHQIFLLHKYYITQTKYYLYIYYGDSITRLSCFDLNKYLGMKKLFEIWVPRLLTMTTDATVWRLRRSICRCSTAIRMTIDAVSEPLVKYGFTLTHWISSTSLNSWFIRPSLKKSSGSFSQSSSIRLRKEEQSIRNNTPHY